MIFRQLFDYETWTYSYVLADERTGEALIIDPVLDQVERDTRLADELGLKLVYAIDTHVHADHVSGSGTLRSYGGAKVALSERSGSAVADVYVKDGDVLEVGDVGLEVRETPGHTDGCISLVLRDRSMVFTGDALLIRGCGRTDFQGGDPRVLYRSITEQLFTLPDSCIVQPAHDYRGHTRSSIGEEKRLNPRLGGGKTEAEFVAIMDGLSLARPKRIDEAVPKNLFAGVPDERDMAGVAPLERGWAPLERAPGGVPEVPAEWVRGHAATARIVDVRTPEEFGGELGHIEGAELVPLDSAIAEAEAWDREQPVVLVCRSGGRSGKVAVDLERRGFKRVASMRGGMRAFRGAA
jgi:sulfur dioxygenase